MTLTTLKGTFAVNKKLSDKLDDLFRLQSVPYIASKVSGIATIQLDVVIQPTERQPTITGKETIMPPSSIFQITMKQTFTAIGPLGLAPLKAIGLAPTRTETRTLDGGEFSDNEAAIGPIKGKWWLTTADEILADDSLDAFHKEASWSRCREVIRISVQSQRPEQAKVWSAEHMWSLEDYSNGDGQDLRYTARLMTLRGSGESREVARVKLVHDFIN
ncbi:hypothetical protein O1611_g3654 [Lasiodiplodia mahajangana]|uniref:Uncharacterized protein n=1 Tax=Lasiodiplodia mahajangana TaxID=1108764 RepID=A0ACC2JR52_9PEZI|nr:hypothetical protein O1611_g3654 [Lasiodiplodia mahajangana]